MQTSLADPMDRGACLVCLFRCLAVTGLWLFWGAIGVAHAAELKRCIYVNQPDGSTHGGPGQRNGILVLDIDQKFTRGAKYVEVDWLDGQIIWAGQDESHGFIFEGYPLDRVRPLLPQGSPAAGTTAGRETEGGTR